MTEKNKKILAGVLMGIAALLFLRLLFGGDDIDDLAASEDADERLLALDKAHNREDEAAAEVLTQLASDPDPRVASRALKTMGHKRDPRHVATLRKQLVDKTRPVEVRAAAAASLGRYDQTQPTELTGMLRAEKDAKVRAGAAQGLAFMSRSRKTEIIPDLYKALSDPDPAVRNWAITGISKMTGHRFEFDAKDKPGSPAHRKIVSDLGQYLRNQKLMN